MTVAEENESDSGDSGSAMDSVLDMGSGAG